jgi:hypothetical protein
MIKDTPFLVRSDLRAWMKNQRDPIVCEQTKVVITGLRHLANDRSNITLLNSLWDAVKALGAAVGRPIVPAE